MNLRFVCTSLIIVSTATTIFGQKLSIYDLRLLSDLTSMPNVNYYMHQMGFDITQQINGDTSIVFVYSSGNETLSFKKVFYENESGNIDSLERAHYTVPSLLFDYYHR